MMDAEQMKQVLLNLIEFFIGVNRSMNTRPAPRLSLDERLARALAQRRMIQRVVDLIRPLAQPRVQRAEGPGRQIFRIDFFRDQKADLTVVIPRSTRLFKGAWKS